MQFNYSKYFYIFLFHIIDTYTSQIRNFSKNIDEILKKWYKYKVKS